MTMQFISRLFFLKGALLLQLRDAVPMFESPLTLWAAGGQSRGRRQWPLGKLFLSFTPMHGKEAGISQFEFHECELLADEGK